MSPQNNLSVEIPQNILADCLQHAQEMVKALKP